MPSPLAEQSKKSVNDQIYESLTHRLERISGKLPPEDQVELDGIVSVFSDDVAAAFRVVVFFGKLK